MENAGASRAGVPIRGAAALALALVATGCAMTRFTREIVTLESPRLDDFSIRYEPMRDCLLKQMVPAHYAVMRLGYRLEINLSAGYNDQPARIEASVSGAANAQLDFPGAANAAETVRTETGWRYGFSSAAFPDHKLLIAVRNDQAKLGEEQFSLHSERCHGLGFGGP